VSSLQVLLDANRRYPGITGDCYFGAPTQQAVIDFQSAHNPEEDGVVAARTTHAINEFSPWLSIFSSRCSASCLAARPLVIRRRRKLNRR
jgi:peptidoglycan hydrolase-like protein with peptidoglycan-binding domain